MTIPEIKKKWTLQKDAIEKKLRYEKDPLQRLWIKHELLKYKEFIADLDTLPECNGLNIDYTKETCTSCGCENHKTE